MKITEDGESFQIHISNSEGIINFTLSDLIEFWYLVRLKNSTL